MNTTDNSTTDAKIRSNREREFLLHTQGIDFSMPFDDFYASLPADMRSQRRAAHIKAVNSVHCWTATQLDAFLSLCRDKFKRAEIEPGTIQL